jgi:sugar/nucleoside kinase (ribokinase family)
MPDIICLGEALVDMVSTVMGLNLVQSPGFNKAAGGAPTNVAAGCALLGASAGLIAKVGQDSFGEYLRQSLWDAGVDLEQLIVTDKYATQLAFVARDERGVPDFAFHVKLSADQTLTPEELDTAYISSGTVFHFGTITLINEPARSATLHALDIAEEAGLLISLDPNLRPPLWPSLDTARETMLEVAERCDLLKVSEEEMRFLTGQEDLEGGVEALHALGPVLVAVTRGPLGAAVYNGRYLLELPAYRVPVVDTTGCGDAFVAAMLVELLASEADIADLEEQELHRIFGFASAAAAITATAEGAIPALPGREEVEELIAIGEWRPPAGVPGSEGGPEGD